jgi:hypothetical protein
MFHFDKVLSQKIMNPTFDLSSNVNYVLKQISQQ